MRSYWISSFAALAAMALVAAGCGDDNNGDGTTEAAVTKAEYVQSVKDRCGEYLKERNAAEQALPDFLRNVADPSQLKPEQLKAASDQIAALDDTTRQVLTDLSELPRPEADRARLDQTFATYDDALAALDEADQAAAEGDGAALSAAGNKLNQALNRNRPGEKEFGFSACG